MRQKDFTFITAKKTGPLSPISLVINNYTLASNIDGISYIRELGFKNLHPRLTKKVFNQCGEIKI